VGLSLVVFRDGSLVQKDQWHVYMDMLRYIELISVRETAGGNRGLWTEPRAGGIFDG
jgi:hypothetical protein